VMEYITTPIYYTNDTPHIGSAYTTLAADVLTRFYRLLSREVFFLTGTDEHGAKIAEAAEKAGQAPQVFVDNVSEQFKTTWDSLNIKPDGFIRTTDPKHEAIVQEFLQDLFDRDEIYLGQYKGWYCISCEEFKTETQIGPNNTCLIHHRELIELEEESYLFRLSKYQGQLRELIEHDDLIIQPISRKNEVLGFIEHEGLKDVAISRKSVPWGVSLPWDKGHTVYVWVDALINYYSAAQPSGPEFDSGKRPQFPPQLQLIGKDILRFHALIWPALLLASGKLLPKQLFVHGFFTIDGQKISKSLGNVILPSELIDRYGVDATRYLLISAIPFGEDGDVSIERFNTIYNSVLANNLGNLVSRFQSMLQKYNDSTVPDVETNLKDSYLFQVARTYKDSFSNFHLAALLSSLSASLDEWNKYIEDKKPWVLAKEEDKTELSTVLATLSEAIFIMSVLYSPFIPETAEKILSGFGSSITQINYDTLLEQNHTAGRKIVLIDPLFPRLL
jgi:methionyl-tRNA synthetase